MVTREDIHECGTWHVEPCQNWGLDMLFDAPSDLVRATFPDRSAGAHLERLTVFCGLCCGVQLRGEESRQAARPESPCFLFDSRVTQIQQTWNHILLVALHKRLRD